jgi:hypothetical protein
MPQPSLDRAVGRSVKTRRSLNLFRPLLFRFMKLERCDKQLQLVLRRDHANSAAANPVGYAETPNIHRSVFQAL